MVKPRNMSRDSLLKKLKKADISLEEFYDCIQKKGLRHFDSPELETELLISNGFPLRIENDTVTLQTRVTPVNEQSFCVVDIETNAGNAKKGQIIEIGAVKIKNGKIIDEYDSLVYANEIPEYIQEVTGITLEMIENSPPLQEVLEEFKLFLDGDLFVAHDIKFDYKFISDSLENFDLGRLENRRLCTIDLAKRVIESEKYGLSTLKEYFDIDIAEHHRALSDARSTAYILINLLELLDEKIVYAEELIDYSLSDNKKIN